jgi:hypothetical protein
MFIASGMLPFRSQSWRAPQPLTMAEDVLQGRLIWYEVRFAGAAKVLNLKDATMPKLDPAPRRAQKRSAFSVSEAVTRLPLASTTLAPVIQSTASPCVCELKPKPPCSECPPTPTLFETKGGMLDSGQDS